MDSKKILILLGCLGIGIHLFGSLPTYLDKGINGMGVGFVVSAVIVYFGEKRKNK